MVVGGMDFYGLDLIVGTLAACIVLYILSAMLYILFFYIFCLDIVELLRWLIIDNFVEQQGFS